MKWHEAAVCAGLACAGLVAAQTRPATPPDPWPDIHRAAALVGNGQFAEARDLAAAVVQADPNQPMGHSLRVLAAERSGDDAATVKACDELTAALPLVAKGAKDEQPRLLWHYYANRHKAEALFRLKRFSEAADAFAAASTLALDCARAFDASQTARWQIQTADRRADALSAAGDHARAIEVRQAVIDRFDRDWQACNNCVRVKAGLVRDLQAAGKAQDAAKVLGAAAADSRLDAVQKSWLAAQASGQAWQPPKPDDKLTTYDGPQSFVIRSEGRWELRVDLTDTQRYGPIGQWYDLETDPLREHNLLTTSYFPILKPHHVNYRELVDGEWKAVDYDRYVRLKDKIDVGQSKAQNDFVVYEAGPGRVRCGYTHKSWPNDSLIYTMYPDGRLYVASHWSLVHPDKTVKVYATEYQMGLSGTTNWRTTIGQRSAMWGEKDFSAPAPFTMEGPNPDHPHYLDPVRATIALATHDPAAHAREPYGNNSLPLAWFRTPLFISFKPDQQPEKDLAFLIHFWPNGRTGFADELPYIEDFQKPAALTMTVGDLVKDDPGDFNRDGFNEAEGCYVVRAADGAVAFTLDGAATARHSPVIKVLAAKGAAADVTLHGKALEEGSSVASSVRPKDAVAIVRLTGAITSAAKVAIRTR